MHYIVCTAESKESWHLRENKLWTKRKQWINEHIWTLQYFSLGLPFGAPFYWLRREEKILDRSHNHLLKFLLAPNIRAFPLLHFSFPFSFPFPRATAAADSAQLASTHPSAQIREHVHLPLKAFSLCCTSLLVCDTGLWVKNLWSFQMCILYHPGWLLQNALEVESASVQIPPQG